MLNYHQLFQQTDGWSKLIQKLNANQWGGSVWDRPEYKNWLANYQSQFGYNPNGGQVSGNIFQGMQPQGQLPASVMAGRQQLASIADQLRNKKLPPTAIPTKPGVKAIPPPVAPEYVQSDRLLAGKGFSKFQRQARGTDRYAVVKQLIDQYYK